MSASGKILAQRVEVERCGRGFPQEDESLPEVFLEEMLGKGQRVGQDLAERIINGNGSGGAAFSGNARSSDLSFRRREDFPMFGGPKIRTEAPMPDFPSRHTRRREASSSSRPKNSPGRNENSAPWLHKRRITKMSDARQPSA
jgi:hypothetical protein